MKLIFVVLKDQEEEEEEEDASDNEIKPLPVGKPMLSVETNANVYSSFIPSRLLLTVLLLMYGIHFGVDPIPLGVYKDLSTLWFISL